MNKKELFEKIVKLKYNYRNMLGQTPKNQGCFVLTGARQGKELNFDNNVGYCVQIRLKAGEYKTNIVGVRHSDGELIAHSNQSFYLIPEEWVEEIQKHFKVKREQEDFKPPYKMNEVWASGWIIRDYNSTQKNIDNF